MSKTVLITGTSSGFGRDTALTLAKSGHKVFASMRDPEGRNRAHADALRAAGVQVVALDVTDEASVEQGVAQVLAKAGRIDVLVNNAGIGAAGLSEAFSTQQLQALFDVNLFGVQRVLRAVLPALRRQGEGLVINIGSVLGRVTMPFFGLYGATKFALEALTESYRYELSQLGVEVVLVQPSGYPTNIFATAIQPKDALRAQTYGEIAAIPGKVAQSFAESLQGENAPNPHEVAEAIAKLVDQAQGARPERVVVGEAFGADLINAQTAPIQAQLVEGLGLSQLAQPRKVQTAA
jgi:NAD(P)-dependent dehydrogenase (short-subunit alcohol dehydrogenase family)